MHKSRFIVLAYLFLYFLEKNSNKRSVFRVVGDANVSSPILGKMNLFFPCEHYPYASSIVLFPYNPYLHTELVFTAICAPFEVSFL